MLCFGGSNCCSILYSLSPLCHHALHPCSAVALLIFTLAVCHILVLDHILGPNPTLSLNHDLALNTASQCSRPTATHTYRPPNTPSSLVTCMVSPLRFATPSPTTPYYPCRLPLRLPATPTSTNFSGSSLRLLHSTLSCIFDWYNHKNLALTNSPLGPEAIAAMALCSAA